LKPLFAQADVAGRAEQGRVACAVNKTY